MKFEEALAAMRNGAKIRHPRMDSDEYFIACRVGLKFDDITPIDELPISITKMKGEYIHPDMGGGGSLDQLPKDFDKVCKHGNYPQLNLLLIMSDDWVIME